MDAVRRGMCGGIDPAAHHYRGDHSGLPRHQGIGVDRLVDTAPLLDDPRPCGIGVGPMQVQAAKTGRLSRNHKWPHTDVSAVDADGQMRTVLERAVHAGTWFQ